jgi:1-pyrroline-5-carboxylate dehydrogenase
VNGVDLAAEDYAQHASPIDRDLQLGAFARACQSDVDVAMRCARAAWPAWRRRPVAERVQLMHRVADVMEDRVYEIAAALVLEGGKNRMEALGEAQETVDFFRHYADDFAAHDGYEHALPDDPLPGVRSTNRSAMRPYGAWVVIAPFNFPLALAGGPAAAALVTGNTVVVKGASDTPWAGRLLADCIRDAGLPPGVFNYLSGSGREVGEALVGHPEAAGLTFTGSAPVGLHLLRQMAGGAWPRPCIAEMGGKNPCIVTARANLDDAAAGIVRSAYGMGGQKCSALSRLYVDRDVADALLERLGRLIAAVRIGDPCRRENWLGPMIHAAAYESYGRYVEELAAGGARIIAGGRSLREGELGRGYYVEPVLAELPLAQRLWKHEMFQPILTVHRVADREEAMRLANDSDLGLTAGFYGGADEVAWFHEHIEAGVTYANRPQGATTGAWPGYQPFGGWKGSGSTGKAIASSYYLAQYLREQSRTVVE